MKTFSKMQKALRKIYEKHEHGEIELKPDDWVSEELAELVDDTENPVIQTCKLVREALMKNVYECGKPWSWATQLDDALVDIIQNELER